MHKRHVLKLLAWWLMLAAECITPTQLGKLVLLLLLLLCCCSPWDWLDVLQGHGVQRLILAGKSHSCEHEETSSW
jgi:hypothetical protein